MKISGCVFQDKMIKEFSENTFDARYKKRNFYITTDHGHGFPKHKHLKRFDITVKDDSGMYDVSTYEDFHNIEDAIREALKGACFLPRY